MSTHPSRPTPAPAMQSPRQRRAARRRAGTQPAAAERLQSQAATLALYAGAVAHLPMGLSAFDAQDRLVLANAQYLDIWRLPAHLGRPGTSFAEIVAASHGTEVAAGPVVPGADGTSTRLREWRLDDGRRVEVMVTRLPGGACVALHRDITDERLQQDQMAYQARHDALTGLPNRILLRETLEQSLPRVARGEELAVLCLDLDHFKAVNDTLGHGAGDALLCQVAERLRGCVRETDVVARLGGDEFAIVQLGAPQPASATQAGRRLIDALQAPFDLRGHQVHIGTSVGIAVAPFDGEDPEALLKSADLALYRAKEDGRNQLRYFEPEMDARMRERRSLEGDLRHAIERGQFELAYQPQVSLPDHALTGVEALLRWNHPVRGRVSPADFIPLAEDSGLIVPIGRWVLRQACQDALQWPAHLGVSVNVSPAQFKSRTLVVDVLSALADTGLPPQRLELEITEAVLMRDTEQALAVMHALRERGVRISMDDFGTGYSSLSYLRCFPFDKIKIDRSFVQGVEGNPQAQAIVRAIVALGGSLGMGTVVEGVETPEQLATVRAEGCDAVQGFVFSRPRPAAEILQLARREAALPAPAAGDRTRE